MISLLMGLIVVAFLPLLVTFVLILLSMICKWGCEWCIRNRYIFKIGEKSKKVKEKLKIDKSINIVKESFRILREKD